jgi:hypothetical protein
VPLIDLDRMPLIDLADEHQAAREETWFCLEWETGNLAMHMVERDLGRGGALDERVYEQIVQPQRG